jgi:hypothetical protein
MDLFYDSEGESKDTTSELKRLTTTPVRTSAKFIIHVVIGSMMASSEQENVDVEKIAMVKKTWQLLARGAANYPAGRKKIEAVTPEGDVIFVKVPEPGVYRGNTFVSEEIPKPEPVMEH